MHGEAEPVVDRRHPGVRLCIVGDHLGSARHQPRRCRETISSQRTSHRLLHRAMPARADSQDTLGKVRQVPYSDIERHPLALGLLSELAMPSSPSVFR